MKNFVTCHCHPQSLDSASTLEAFAEREIELGTGHLTVTDHGTHTACRKAYDVAHSNKLIPILGCEAYFRDDQCPIITAAGVPKTYPKIKNKDGTFSEDRSKQGTFIDFMKYQHLTIHYLDQQSYEAGVRILSRADLNRAEWHGSERKPLYNWQDLEELGGYNTTMTSGCLIGMVQRFILDHERLDLAEAYYQKLRSVVKPGNFFVEVFPHLCSHNWVEGAFVHLKDGTKLKYHAKKKLRTNAEEEVTATKLVKDWETKGHKHTHLIGVKNYHTWDVYSEPKEIDRVEWVEDFLQNECRPWCPDGDVQAGCNKILLYLAQKYGDTVIIGDDSHFAHIDEKIIQDVRLRQNGTWRFFGNYSRQSSDEAFEYFKRIGTDQKTFEGWVDNSYAWAARFENFKFDNKPELPTKFYPSDTLDHTISLIRKHGRMDWNNPVYLDRLQREIQLLHHNGKIDLLPYLFIDEEACGLYEKADLLTGVGRGSAAGLLLSYLIGITHVDPLEMDLSLDRFLTLDRINEGKLPDIDQDLPNRDLLVDPKDPSKGWLAERFPGHVAQISVDTKLKLKMAVLDVARFTYGKVPEDVARLSQRFRIPPQGVDDYDFVLGYDTPEGHVKGSIEQDHSGSDKALQEYVAKYPDQWEIVQKCLGLSRQRGRHACAFCITNRPIADFIPMTKVSDVPVTGYTAESVEAVGGIKMDFLVINVLNDISDCIKLVQQRSGLEIPHETQLEGRRVPKIRLVPHDGQFYDVWKLWVSPHSAPVFRDVSEGKTETVFQFNTAAAIQWLEHFNYEKPDGTKAIGSIQDMAAFTALDRPGPLDIYIDSPDGQRVNMLEEYARRARGLQHSATLPIFTELLPETHGVMVYQEQLQKVYQVLTGCTGPQAEEFRANVAKKKKAKIEKAYPFFIERASQRLGKEQAEETWQFFITWAKYGFNKSHAVCYAVTGFVCAYLKHHFPLEWWCSVLKNAPKNEINEKFWKHCGHLIKLPDASLSGETFQIEGDGIRAPLNLLHGVGEMAHQQLNAGRPYRDIDDFCEKIQAYKVANTRTNEETGKTRLGTSALNRKVVYTLIIGGTMDSLFPVSIKRPLVGDTLDGGFIEEPMDVATQLRLFEEALARATKKKAQKIDSKYLNVNQIVRFQMRKAILPAYTEHLTPMLIDRQIENISVVEGGKVVYTHKNAGRVPIVSGVDFERLSNLKLLGESINVAAAVYVEDVRRFSYGAEGKQACEIIMDLDGTRVKSVKWGGKTGKLVGKYGAGLKGTVAIAVLTRYNENRPFSIEDIEVVQDKLDHAEEQSPGGK